MKKFITVFLLVFITTFILGETLVSLPKPFQSLYQQYSYSTNKGKTYIEQMSKPGLFIITTDRIIFRNNTLLDIKSVDRIESGRLVNYIVSFKASKKIWIFNSIENHFTQVRIVDSKYREIIRYNFRIDE